MDKLMRKDNLVIIKDNKSFTKSHTEFKANTYFRSIQLSEGDECQILIFGEVFTFEEFQDKFEYVTDRVLKHWVDINLLKVNSDGDLKPLTFTAFSKQADIHTYTGYYNGRKIKNRILFFRTDKNVMYGFYPNNATKLNDIRESYQMYLDTVSGITEHLDDGSIQFGNCGIPLSYGDLRKI